MKVLGKAHEDRAVDWKIADNPREIDNKIQISFLLLLLNIVIASERMFYASWWEFGRQYISLTKYRYLRPSNYHIETFGYVDCDEI